MTKKRSSLTASDAKTKPVDGLAERRSAGRPGNGDAHALSRELIVEAALDLARHTPLHEISVVRVASELTVTPGLIRYYTGGRDGLTSGVMNAFSRELVSRWPKLSGQWRADLEAVCRTVYAAYVEYAGIAAYNVTHNKFRMVQIVREGETDYGITLFDRFTSAVRAIGFDAERTGIYTHLLNEFVTAYAQATAARRWPGEHAGFLGTVLAGLDKTRFPGAHYVSKTFGQLDAQSAFEIGLGVFMDGLETDRRRRPQPPKAKSRP